jgi:hypothetical protein
MGAYLISNWRSSTVSIFFDSLLPQIHLFAFAGFGLLKPTRFIAMGTTLGQAAGKSRGRVMNVPPIVLPAGIAAVTGHRLQVKAGTQAFGGDGIGNNAAVALVKYAAPGYISRLLPKTTHSFEVTE